MFQNKIIYFWLPISKQMWLLYSMFMLVDKRNFILIFYLQQCLLFVAQHCQRKEKLDNRCFTMGSFAKQL